MRARRRLIATAHVALIGAVGLAVAVGGAPTAFASAHQVHPGWLPTSTVGSVGSLVTWRFAGLAAGSSRAVVPATTQLLGTTTATVTVR